jgi:hypothetical protein
MATATAGIVEMTWSGQSSTVKAVKYWVQYGEVHSIAKFRFHQRMIALFIIFNLWPPPSELSREWMLCYWVTMYFCPGQLFLTHMRTCYLKVLNYKNSEHDSHEHGVVECALRVPARHKWFLRPCLRDLRPERRNTLPRGTRNQIICCGSPSSSECRRMKSTRPKSALAEGSFLCSDVSLLICTVNWETKKTLSWTWRSRGRVYCILSFPVTCLTVGGSF